jgi:hypothetical protein
MPTARITYTGTAEMQYVIYVEVEVQLHLFLTSAGGAVSLGEEKTLLSLLESNQDSEIIKPVAWSLL